MNPRALACMVLLFLALSFVPALASAASPPGPGSDSAQGWFDRGRAAYQAGNYKDAAAAFRAAAERQVSAGTLLNLGNAEWQRGRAGDAVLAWERVLWVDPYRAAARNNLALARKTGQLESPNLAWYEVVSTWLPMNAWAWIAGLSFWLAISMLLLPAVLRLKRAAWHQAVAACGLTLFLLSLPAHAGIYTRSNLGFIRQKDTPLRLTPTSEAQAVTRLAAGEPARLVRTRGPYALVRTPRSQGWVLNHELGLLSGDPGRNP